jgi:hypothetical protein
MAGNDTPTDPEAAALAIIATLPSAALKSSTIAPMLLQDFADQLAAEGAFTGLGWSDARHVAQAICAELLTGTGSVADRLRNAARDALAGTDGNTWVDRERVSRAFTIAAALLS